MTVNVSSTCPSMRSFPRQDASGFSDDLDSIIPHIRRCNGMKRIVWLALLTAMLIVSAASAAYVEINAPKTVYVGEPFEVTGTSIVGDSQNPRSAPGSARISSYLHKHTKSEVGRKTIVVQEDGTFSATFDTRVSAAGDDTVEIIDPSPEYLRGQSKTLQFLKLIDRSGISGSRHRSPRKRTAALTSPVPSTVSGVGVQIRSSAAMPPSTGLNISGPMLMEGSL